MSESDGRSAAAGRGHRVGRLVMRMAALEHPWLLAYGLSYLAMQALALVPGILQGRLFDALLSPPAGGAARAVTGLLAGLLAVGLGSVAAEAASELAGASFRGLISGRVRCGLVAELMARPAASGLPVPVGETIARLNEDNTELADFPLWLPHVAVHLAAGAFAFGLMLSVDVQMTMVVVLPALVLIVSSRLAWSRLLRYRHAARRAGDEAVASTRDALGAVQALKLGGAIDRVVENLARLNRRRRDAATRDVSFGRLLDSSLTVAVEYGLAVTLLLSGPALAAGRMSVGEFAMFVYYLRYVTQLPQIIGMFLGDWRQQGVSLERLEAAAQPATITQLLACGRVSSPGCSSGAPDVKVSEAAKATYAGGTPLLTVEGLAYHYPVGARGIQDIDFQVHPGRLVVIAGPVGSGKTTVLRAVLGLVPASGSVGWQGLPVARPQECLRPPRCAYVAQVPGLLSGSLADNLLLGRDRSDTELAMALADANLDEDLGQLEAGLRTPVGPRGMRLSGGQVQRAALARALLGEPQLLVLDDPASAVDAATGRALWHRLRERTELAILAATNQRRALESADEIILLDDGNIVSRGRLAELLGSSPLMRALWRQTETSR